jgi:GNAT superfamily N-acetyltransferase
VTDRAARRHGVGRALARAAAEIAREAGCEKLYVRTNRRRQESPPFYRSLGFEDTHLTFDLPLRTGGPR